ncbi:MAG: hypothetical protein ACO32I_02730 [Candidatus Limnocylindrus sp.]
MYDDILLEQAALWDMVKEASTPLVGEFDRLSNTDKMRLARGKFGRDATSGEKLTRKDTEYSRRQRAAAMVGRGTGYYDIQSGRQALKRARTIEDQFGAKAVRDARRAGSYVKSLKNISKADEKLLRREFIKKQVLGSSDPLAYGRVMGSFGGTAKEKDMLAQIYAAEVRKKTWRGLMLRGAGKAGLVAGGLGAAGYGLSKLSSYDPVVEYVQGLDGFEFAAEAEARAAEILLENGIDPETFEPCYPEHVKIASFPEVGDADTYEGDEELAAYNDMLDDAALDILEALGF